MKNLRHFTLIMFVLCITALTHAQNEDVSAGTVQVDIRGIEMVYVPAGVFEFGIHEEQARSLLKQSLNAHDVERYISAWKLTGIMPPVEVEVADFWMDRYEVTVAQYQPYLRMCLELGFCREATNRIPETIGSDNYPQVEVSWIDALRYCMWRDARLPTEIEWEYAASGPDNLMFPWGNEPSVDFEPRLYDVGTLAKNVSWIGIYDMAGNAEEWVDDLYITRMPSKENINFGEANRVMRGGSFTNGSSNANAFSRGEGGNADGTSPLTGFRCARSTNP